MAQNVRFYPTPASVTYYIGDILIDDMYRVDFQRRKTDQPIWGYDSKNFDFVAQGKQIISGNLIINYRYPGYLRNVIVKPSIAGKETKKMVDDRMNAADGTERTLQFFQTISSVSLEEKAKLLANEIVRSQNNNNVNKSVNAKAGSVNTLISQLKSDMRKINGSIPVEERIPDTGQNTADQFYRSVLDEPDVQFFNLSVRYGFQNIVGGYIRTFKDCFIVGESETVSASAGVGGDMSSSSQPILEVYPFVARDLVVERYP